MSRSNAPPAERMLSFEESTVLTRSGPRMALVMTPQLPVIVGHMRMAQLRHDAGPGPIDEEMLKEVRRRNGRVQILMMRGQNDDGSGRWSIDPSLTDEEAAELGYLLNKSQIPTYRRFLALGVIVYVHAEFGRREADAFRRGADRLLEELQKAPEKDAATMAIRRVDAWILRNLTFFFSLGASAVLTDVLPNKTPLFEARLPRIREMLATLPPEAID